MCLIALSASWFIFHLFMGHHADHNVKHWWLWEMITMWTLPHTSCDTSRLRRNFSEIISTATCRKLQSPFGCRESPHLPHQLSLSHIVHPQSLIGVATVTVLKSWVWMGSLCDHYECYVVKLQNWWQGNTAERVFKCKKKFTFLSWF